MEGDPRVEQALEDVLEMGRQLRAAGQNPPPRDPPDLNDRGGGRRFDPMESRVTRLEVQMQQMDRTLTSIDGKLDKVNDRLVLLPTKSDLTSWRLQWTAIALAVVAVVIGGIIGGLAWIQPEPSAPTPIIVQTAPPKG